MLSGPSLCHLLRSKAFEIVDARVGIGDGGVGDLGEVKDKICRRRAEPVNVWFGALAIVLLGVGPGWPPASERLLTTGGSTIKVCPASSLSMLKFANC
jgi:hypothetical protein